MSYTPDEGTYKLKDSLWNPCFVEAGIEKEYRLHIDSISLPALRIGLGIIIFFWWILGFFDLLLSPSARFSVLFFRFGIITPLFLLIGLFSFSKFAARFYQPMVLLLEALTFFSLIKLLALYDNLETLVSQYGFQLSIPSEDAKFIYVSVWILVVFIASLTTRIRSKTALALSSILLAALAAAVITFKPSIVVTAIAASFAFACIPVVYIGVLKMQLLERYNYQKTKLLERTLDTIKTMFGRYLSTEVMTSLIENPSALELGGEKRKVTIMMTDLRGFTALSERLKPEQVVQMLNNYFEVMVEVVLKYRGTITAIIGDALLIIFGAPQDIPNRTQSAIACAIDMQNEMVKVNEQNRSKGLPELEMGVGLNEAEVILGNIGSSKRSQYTVVGSGVNMASRIESYTVGGQVLVSESILREVGEAVRIDSVREVFPKGADTSLRIFEVGGIAGEYNIALDVREPSLLTLKQKIPVNYTVVEGKSAGRKGLNGTLVRLSRKSAGIVLEEPVDVLTNLKINLKGVDESLSVKYFYGKIIEAGSENEKTFLIRFTSVPPEIDAYFQSYRQLSGVQES